MKFDRDQTVVALSHMDDDYAYIFGISEYIDYLRPAVDLPWKENETGCIVIRDDNGNSVAVWEFQSMFYTKDDFRDFIDKRKIKRVQLDHEVRISNLPSYVSTKMLESLQGQTITALLVEYLSMWKEEGIDANDLGKYEIKDDGNDIKLIERETGKVIPNTPKIEGFLQAFYAYAKQERDNIINIHSFYKQHVSENQSKQAQGETTSPETEEVSENVEHRGQEQGDDLPKDSSENVNV